ncbi:MAG: ASCH domain-containing protein [Ornithinimicrobium sp.]|uniref:ASCH domain-containing protein n=1 Tax=Ornithinimicrobium sp. TaxID=1977084 RepID=UPI0026E09FCA|nr:ASCH domain-containing protein [Ornithinimicrobium sp.]MDO5741183.1 ASCH domain-containing protein [Ornithinimicrobium sp.]
MEDVELRSFWDDAKIRAGLNPADGYFGRTAADTVLPAAWSFGDTPEEADRLLDLMLQGRRTATSSAAWEYDDELPEAGVLSIVLDGDEHPRALIASTEVSVTRFGDVDEAHARREGEESLESWRRTYRALLARRAPEGVTVDDDTQVVLERFTVLVPVSAAHAAKRAGLD